MSIDRVNPIAQESYARMLGVELVEAAEDRVVARLPYRNELGDWPYSRRRDQRPG